jgi:hypothetical protein
MHYVLPSGEEGLILDVVIECELCGSYIARVHGHHLRALLSIVQDTINLYPGLAGPEVTAGETVHLPLTDPTKSELN